MDGLVFGGQVKLPRTMMLTPCLGSCVAENYHTQMGRASSFFWVSKAAIAAIAAGREVDAAGARISVQVRNTARALSPLNFRKQYYHTEEHTPGTVTSIRRRVRESFSCRAATPSLAR